MPGTDRWKPIIENPEAEETVPGVLIVRIRENLDFGMSFVSILIIKFCTLIFFCHSKHFAAERFVDSNI